MPLPCDEVSKQYTITATPLVGAVIGVTRSRQELLLENALLRQQLLVLNRQVKRPQLRGRDRAVIVGLASRLSTWKNALLIVKPETVLRWHRELFRRHWRRKSAPKGAMGRPRLPTDQVALIRRLAKENLSWGSERIRGELLKLGLPIAKSTIQPYLKGRCAAGPAARRGILSCIPMQRRSGPATFFRRTIFGSEASLYLSSSN
jgi:putative transposase